MKGKRILFYLSEILIIFGILFVYNYLSLGNYGTPFGINLEEMDNRVIIEEYDWKGNVSNQFQLDESRLDNPKESIVTVEVLEYQFKGTFAAVVSLVLSLLSSFYIKVISDKLNIPLRSGHISAKWSRIFLILILGIYIAVSIMTVLKYNDLIIESENLLNELEPYLRK
ncbi:hypothetical protein [Halobacillus amylolyticus]|uniref:Uncharacterized protein n=1 Tax=Halobacillus amylolyticus TaxID=2932259 RepID=A0ABY4HIJ8_9BACI|nr:hypothetical protein [Halobacillus amylolyticus]UOR13265.1 hypothetical protein MUO15_07200 [Halobacillus amylolyticus]